MIPNWHLRADRVLYWDRYSRPDVPVKNGVATGLWWFDQNKSDALDSAMANTDLTGESSSETSPGWGTTLLWLLLGTVVLVFVIRKTMTGKS